MHILEAAHEHSSAKGDKTRRLTINDLVQAVRTDPDTARLFADFSFSTHTSVIQPRKVQKMIMTPKDWAALQAKKAEKAQSAAGKGWVGQEEVLEDLCVCVCVCVCVRDQCLFFLKGINHHTAVHASLRAGRARSARWVLSVRPK